MPDTDTIAKSSSRDIGYATVRERDATAHAKTEAGAQAGAITGAATAAGVDATVQTGQAIADGTRDVYQSGKETTKDAARATGAFVSNAGENVKSGSKKAYAATAQTAQQAKDQATGFINSARNAWTRGFAAAAGEKPITFLGYNSMNIAAAGSLLGLGLGLAGLFTAITIYVPVSYILLAVGSISLLDLVSSLVYRSRVKAQNELARPLTAFAEGATLDEAALLKGMGNYHAAYMAKVEAKEKAREAELAAMEAQLKQHEEAISTNTQQKADAEAKLAELKTQHTENVDGATETVTQVETVCATSATKAKEHQAALEALEQRLEDSRVQSAKNAKESAELKQKVAKQASTVKADAKHITNVQKTVTKSKTTELTGVDTKGKGKVTEETTVESKTQAA